MLRVIYVNNKNGFTLEKEMQSRLHLPEPLFPEAQFLEYPVKNLRRNE
jgi:hypothetical protein